MDPLIKYKKNLSLGLSILLLLIFLLSYLIPAWYTALNNQFNYYANAWDEANYFTHQMAQVIKFSPGYWFGEYIYIGLESFGISGAWQNLLFDTVLIPFILLAVAFFLKRNLNISLSNAIIFSILICFSSLLFSYTNKLIGDFFFYQFPDDKSFLIASEISFPAILHAPNPLFSYVIIVIALLFYMRYRKSIILIIPLPFLCFPVFIFYFYIICAWIIYKLFNKSNLKLKILFANLFSSFLTIILLWTLTRMQMIKDMVLFSKLTHAEAYIASDSYHFQLPLIFLIFFCFIPVLLFQKKQITWFFYVTFLFALIICSNTQIFTGIMFAPKVFQSSSAVILGGIMLTFLLYPLNEANNNVIQFPKIYFFYSLLTVIIIFILMNQLFLSIELWEPYFHYFIRLSNLKTKIGIIFLSVSSVILIGYWYVFRDKIFGICTIALCLTILGLLLQTQGFSLAEGSYTIFKYTILSQQQIELLKTKSPFILIIGPDADFYAQYFPYSIPHIYSPIQSVHYTYLPFILSCNNNLHYMNEAVNFAQNLNIDAQMKKHLMSKLEKNAKLNSLILQNFPVKFLNVDYCIKNNEISPEFHIIEINDPIRKIKLRIL